MHANTIALTLVSSLVGCDLALRRAGAYDEAAGSWPEGWSRADEGRADPAAPYRSAATFRWVRRVREGVPFVVSAPALAVFVLAFLWSIALVMGSVETVGDLRHPARIPRDLASFSLCFTRASAGWIVGISAMARLPRRFARAVALSLALDGALMLLPIPCSTRRSDDIVVASAGFAVSLLLALGFAWSQARRRRLGPAPNPLPLH